MEMVPHMGNVTNDRTWAERNLRAFLLNELDVADEDRVNDALFAYDGLTLELADAERELMKAFLDRKLELDASRNPRLIHRWSRPDARAQLQLMKLQRGLQTRTAAVQVQREAGTKRWFIPWAWVGAATAAALVVFLAVRLADSNRQIRDMAQQVRRLQKVTAENAALRAQNDALTQVPEIRRKTAPTSRPAGETQLETRLAGETQILKARANGGEVSIDPLKGLYWDVPLRDIELYEVRLHWPEGREDSRRLSNVRGQVVILA